MFPGVVLQSWVGEQYIQHRSHVSKSCSHTFPVEVVRKGDVIWLVTCIGCKPGGVVAADDSLLSCPKCDWQKEREMERDAKGRQEEVKMKCFLGCSGDSEPHIEWKQPESECDSDVFLNGFKRHRLRNSVDWKVSQSLLFCLTPTNEAVMRTEPG